VERRCIGAFEELSMIVEWQLSLLDLFSEPQSQRFFCIGIFSVTIMMSYLPRNWVDIITWDAQEGRLPIDLRIDHYKRIMGMLRDNGTVGAESFGGRRRQGALHAEHRVTSIKSRRSWTVTHLR
jgi:hypothetical protein